MLNEAEATLPEFLRDFAAGATRRVYQSSLLPDLSQTPVPLWELADLRRYASMSLQYSRGCPFDCEFCNITSMFGHRPRTKTTAQVIAELDLLRNLGWRGAVFFVDDNFIGNQRALKTWQFVDNFAWLKGAHNIKFGVNFRFGSHQDTRGSVGGYNVAQAVDFSRTVNTVDAARFNLPADTLVQPGVPSCG